MVGTKCNADTDEDAFTGVIGARFAKTFEVSPAASVVARVRPAVTYDIVDADNISFVTLAYGGFCFIDVEMLDDFGLEAEIFPLILIIWLFKQYIHE